MRHRHRPRPPPVRPAQTRRLRRRLAQVTADGGRVAHFYVAEVQTLWAKVRSLDDDLAEWRGRALWAEQRNRAWLAHARTAWHMTDDWTGLVGERAGGD